MRAQLLEVVNKLENIEKLNADNYKRLIKKYGEVVVQQVIEKILEEGGEKASKFEYYVTKIMTLDGKKFSNDMMDLYLDDLTNLPCFSSEESTALACELHGIIIKINELLETLGYEEDNISWISDRVDKCLDECIDKEVLNQLKKLYGKFIYLRDMLVEGNLRLVISFAKNFYYDGVDFNELVQLGNIGFMRALEKFDPSYNTCLSTYAYHWVKKNIACDSPRLVSQITIPYNVMFMNTAINKATKKLLVELHRTPTEQEIALELSIPVEKVQRVNQICKNVDTVSIDRSIVRNDKDNNVYSILDAYEDYDSNIEKNVFSSDMALHIREIMKQVLTEKEYEVMCYRFGFEDYDPITLEETGHILGVTRERVRQIESGAIRKIARRKRELQIYVEA